MMKVAIALPVYNGADHFEEALESFRRQTFTDFELVICDNVSSDQTPEISQLFARKDSRFIYRRQTEFLPAKDNFLRAYRLTDRASKYFLWACDDNLWHPDFLSRTVDYMESHSGCSACGVYLHHFGDGAVRNVATPVPLYFKVSKLAQFAFERMSLVSLYSLMRRSAVDNIVLDVGNIRDYPDRYYLAQLRASGYFHVVEEDLLGFRDGGISSTGDDPWVRTVIDTNFAEEELKLLFSLTSLTLADKMALAAKWTYIALRHNIPNVAERWWLAPIRAVSQIANAIKPSPWKVTDRGLQRVD